MIKRRKQMLVKLTQKTNTLPMYINSKMVVAFDAAKDGVGTRMIFDNDFAYEFLEEIDEVKAKLKCHGLFCSND